MKKQYNTSKIPMLEKYLTDYIKNNMPENSEKEQLEKIKMTENFEKVFGYNPLRAGE